MLEQHRQLLLAGLVCIDLLCPVIWCSSAQSALAATRLPVPARPPAEPKPPVIVQPGANLDEHLASHSQAGTIGQPDLPYFSITQITGGVSELASSTHAAHPDDTKLILLVASVLTAAGIAYSLDTSKNRIIIAPADANQAKQAISIWAQQQAANLGQAPQELFNRALSLLELQPSTASNRPQLVPGWENLTTGDWGVMLQPRVGFRARWRDVDILVSNHTVLTHGRDGVAGEVYLIKAFRSNGWTQAATSSNKYELLHDADGKPNRVRVTTAWIDKNDQRVLWSHVYLYDVDHRDDDELAARLALAFAPPALDTNLFVGLLRLQLEQLQAHDPLANAEAIAQLRVAIATAERRLGTSRQPPKPIQAVLHTTDGQTLLLRLFLTKQANGNWAIVDLTDPRPGAARTYQGRTVAQAWQHFVEENQLPAGQLAAQLNGQVVSGKSNGTSTLQEWSGGLSMLSLATGVGGLVMLFIPGAEPLGGAMLAGSLASGAGASTLNLVDRGLFGNLILDEATALDVLNIIGSLAAGGMMATGKQLAVREIGSVVVLGEALDKGSQLGSGIVLSRVWYQRIQNIRNNPQLSVSEKQKQIDAVLHEAYLAGGLIVIGMTAHGPRGEPRPEVPGGQNAPDPQLPHEQNAPKPEPTQDAPLTETPDRVSTQETTVPKVAVPDAPKDWIEAYDAYQAQAIAKLAQARRMTVEQYLQAVNKHVGQIVRRAGIYRRINPDTLPKILADQRIKNRFETLTGEMSDSLRNQDFVERTIMGVDTTTMSAEQRPVYGYLSELPNGNNPNLNNFLGGSGSAIIRFKDTVAEKATFTVGDTVNNTNAGQAAAFVPQSLADPGYRAVDFVGRYDLMAYPPNPRDPLLINSVDRIRPYIEVQIYHPTIGDIQDISFLEPPSPAITAQLDAAHIPWKYIGR